MTRPAARVGLFLVLVLVGALYAPSLSNRFALDDGLVAKAVREDGTRNEMVAELQPLWRYFQTNYWHGFLDRDILFRPVTVLSYAAAYAALGRHLELEAGEALPQHAVNLALHLLATWLVYRLARTALAPRGASLVAALAFGVHALHSEVVAGIVGRAELLAFTFGALASLAAVRASGPARRMVGYGAAAAVAMFLALGSKESAVAWVAWAPVFWFVRTWQGPAAAGAASARPAGPRLGAWILVTVLPLLIFLALRASVIARLGTDAATWTQSLIAATPGSPRGNALVQWAFGLRTSLLPTHLSADWGPMVFTPVPSPTAPAALLALGVLLAALALGIARCRRYPLLALATVTWFGHGFLVSNVPFRIGTDYAERLYYAPSLGVALLAAWLAVRLRPTWRWPALVALGSWVAWNGWLILQRNPVWRDNPALHRHECEHQPRSVRLQLQWAGMLEKRGEVEAARVPLERAVELMPQLVSAWNHLGTVHARAGRTEAARACFERAVAAPDGDGSVRVAAAVNLALARSLSGDVAGAAAALDAARRADARQTAARLPELRAAFAGRLSFEWFDGFVAALQRAAPDARAWACERAALAHDAGRPQAAVAHAREALASPLPQPLRAQMQIVLASGLAAGGDGAGAARVVDDLLADPTVPPELVQQARTLRARWR